MRDDEESANRIWPALISVSLRDDKYGVASGIVWNVDLALAWTNISFAGRELAFWWRIHELPSPMRLLGWAKEWETQFVRKLSDETSYQRERVAYAWVYYQLLWMSADRENWIRTHNLPPPFDDSFNQNKNWKKLLSIEPETGTPTEKARCPCFWKAQKRQSDESLRTHLTSGDPN
jgi:hypothetical protein